MTTGFEPLTFEYLRHINTKRCRSLEDGFGHGLHVWSLSDWMVAACGELGEACNIVKKLNRERDNIKGNKDDRATLDAKLRLEIGDTLIYLDLVAASQGFTLAEAVTEAFNSKSDELGSSLKL